MTQLPGLDREKTGQAARVIFLPPRFYKPKGEWTDEDWRDDWVSHVRHRRNIKAYRTWEEGRDRVLAAQRSIEENSDYRGWAWAWILFIGLCILGIVLLLLSGNMEPITYPGAPYEGPYIWLGSGTAGGSGIQ